MFNKSDKRLKVEKYPLPDTLDEICGLVRHVLQQGGVQKLELSMGDVVRVSRFIPDDGTEVGEVEMSLDAALRNVNELVEYINNSAPASEVLLDMMLLVQQEGLHPVAWTAGFSDEDDLLDQWLDLQGRGMPKKVPGLLGLPLHRLASLPEDTLILCASQYANPEPNEISFAVKAAIEVRRPHEHRELPSSVPNDSIRDGNKKYLATAHQLAVTPFRGRSQS